MVGRWFLTLLCWYLICFLKKRFLILCDKSFIDRESHFAPKARFKDIKIRLRCGEFNQYVFKAIFKARNNQP